MDGTSRFFRWGDCSSNQGRWFEPKAPVPRITNSPPFRPVGGPSANLHQLMKLTAISLCYTSFLRFDDLVTVQWQTIKFVAWAVAYGTFDSEQQNGPISPWRNCLRRSPRGSVLSGSLIVQRHLSAGQYRLHNYGPLIRSALISPPLQHIEVVSPLLFPVNSWLKEAASILSLDTRYYGTHSGRRGGVVAPLPTKFLIVCLRAMDVGALSALRHVRKGKITR
jgi:hypothetical protein